MPANDLALLIEAARTAGQIALSFWQRDPRIWTKADDSPVSAADLAVDEALRDALLMARPDYGWMSEETPDTPDRLAARHCFILDPIDGTRAFLKGERTWAVSLAVTTGSRPTAAVIHLPARDLTYTAVQGDARCNGAPLAVSTRAEPDGARILANKATFAPHHWTDLPGFDRSFRPSMAYRLACVADAKTDTMLTLRPAWEWDIAAGALIAEAAGATVTDRHGGPLIFNSPGRMTDGVIAANPALHDAIRARLS